MQRTVLRSEASTDDLDEGIAATRELFGSGVDIAPPESGGTTVAIGSLRAPELQAIRWRMSGTSRGRRDQAEEAQASVLAGVVVAGRLELRTRGDTRLDCTRPFIYPEYVDSQVSAPDLAVLSVPHELLDVHARAMTGDDGFRVRFIGSAPTSHARDRIWRNTMRYASLTLAELAAAGEADTDLPTVGLLDLVATQMLRAFPNTALEVEQERNTGGAGTTHGAVRRALRFIDDNLDRPFSVVDLAEASGLSLRGLHAAFRRELDVTPMRFVRRTRLAAARADLQDRDAATTDLQAVALRWGFAGAEHFARSYRSEFGETPGHTLRR